MFEIHRDFRNRIRASADPELIANVQRAARDIGDRIANETDCTQCGQCCRVYSVSSTSRDIKRLADHLEMDPFHVRKKYFVKDHEGDLVFRQRPCPFLRGAKCGVYLGRPDTCRSYPHLSETHIPARGWHIVENTLVCPIVFGTYQELLKRY